jgi:hypothetical protein
LTPPSGDECAINGILDEQAAAIEDLQALQRAAARNDRSGFQAALNEFNQRNARIDAEVQRYGLTGCGG